MDTTRIVPQDSAIGRVPTVDELKAAFAEFLRLDVANGDASPDTVTTYTSNLVTFLDWCKREGVHPAQATPHDLKLYRRFLVESGYARATIAVKLAVVRRFYAMAQAWGFRPDDPGAGLKPPKERTDRGEKVQFLTLPELRRLLDAPDTSTAAGKRDLGAMTLMARLGLRVGEVRALKVDDLDFEHRTILVHGKGNKQRTLCLTEPISAVLLDWLAARDEVARPGVAALFVRLDNGDRGRGMTKRAVEAAVDGYLERCGLKRPRLGCHALRHTFATLALANGADVLAVSKALGHSDLKTTMRYLHLVNRKESNPARFIDAALEAL